MKRSSLAGPSPYSQPGSQPFLPYGKWGDTFSRESEHQRFWLQGHLHQYFWCDVIGLHDYPFTKWCNFFIFLQLLFLHSALWILLAKTPREMIRELSSQGKWRSPEKWATNTLRILQQNGQISTHSVYREAHWKSY